jgi:hypothetical protein
MIGNHRNKTTESLINLHNNGEDGKHAHGFADF